MALAGWPSLALGSSVTAPTARNATQVVLHGLQPPLGESGPWMPPFATVLTDDQVAAVLAYVRARYTDLPPWPGGGASVNAIRQDRHS